jgi:hypothetical protein
VVDVTIKMEPCAAAEPENKQIPGQQLFGGLEKFDLLNFQHKGAKLSASEFTKSFRNICFKHNIEGEASQEILTLLKTAGDVQNLLGLDEVENILQPTDHNLKLEKYCRMCSAEVEIVSSCKACKNTKDMAIVVKNDVESQLKHLLEHKGLAEILEKQSFPRESQGSMIRDVTDGLRYKTLPRTSKFDISFILGSYFTRHDLNINIHVVTVLAIAELEPRLRQDFLILNEIWYFARWEKPGKQLLYPSITDTFGTLLSRGVTWTCPWNKEEMKSKVFILACSLEYGELLSIFQGIDSDCNFCEQKRDAPFYMPYFSPAQRPEMLNNSKVLMQ